MLWILSSYRMLLFYLINYGGLHHYTIHIWNARRVNFTLFYSIHTGCHNLECLMTFYCDWCWKRNTIVSTFLSLSSVVKQWTSISFVIIEQGLCQMIKWCTGNLMFQISNLCIYIYISHLHDDIFDEYILTVATCLHVFL